MPEPVAGVDRRLVLEPAQVRAALDLMNDGLAAGVEALLDQFTVRGADGRQARLLLANLGLELGRPAATLALAQAVVHADPDCAGANYLAGRALEAMGRPGEALAALERAVALDPTDDKARYALGNVRKGLGHLDAAVAAYDQVLERWPAFAPALNNLGNALRDLGRLGAAEDAFRRAALADPELAEAHQNLGSLLHQRGALDEAAACYGRLAELRPDTPAAHLHRGNVLKDQGRTAAAVAAFRRALALDPGLATAWNNLAVVFKEQGDVTLARQAWSASLAVVPGSMAAVSRALLMPVIAEGNDEIREARRQLARELDRLAETPLPGADPYRPMGSTAFHLAYHGLDNRALQIRIADVYRRLAPDLAWQAPLPRRPKAGKRIRVGLVSRFFHRHTIGYLFEGVVRHLDRRRFEAVVFRFPGRPDPVAAAIDEAADRTVTLPVQVPAARRAIADQHPDILLYPDIGMEPLTYFLAHARLAPVQATTWGHPDTTGIPAMDFYLSNDLAEPPGAEAHYSETLVRLPRFLMFCHRPAAPAARRRADFGLAADRRLYICPQSLFKLHPDIDPLLAGILEQDARAQVVLFEGRHPQWREALQRRLRRTCPAHAARIVFLPRVAEADFTALLRLADAVIDSIHFSGGYTSLLALGSGIPVVTWPGGFMRGRLTAALYAQMGMDACVARSPAHYVELALRLANDADWRQNLGSEIGRRSAVLFDDPSPIRALEDFLEAAAAGRAAVGKEAP